MPQISYTDSSYLHRVKERILLSDTESRKRMLHRAIAVLILMMIVYFAGRALYDLVIYHEKDQTQNAQLLHARAQLEDKATQDLESEQTTHHSSNVSTDEKTSKEEQICIHVTGSVKTPGLVHLASTARINDAITAAGGLTEDADAQQLNLATRLKDGMRVYVPKQGEIAPASSNEGTSTSGGEVSTTIDINTADVNALTAIPGVGEKTAQKIVDNRSKQGKFASIDDLSRVPGIGEKKLDSIRPYITASP